MATNSLLSILLIILMTIEQSIAFRFLTTNPQLHAAKFNDNNERTKKSVRRYPSKLHYEVPSMHSSTKFPSRTEALSLISSCIITTIFPHASHGMYNDPKTNILLPEEGEIESSIPPTWNDDDNPFSTSSNSFDPKTSFSRLDSTSDSIFYKSPRFVEHVDDNAVRILEEYLSRDNVLHTGDSILDLCSSWTSHIPKDIVQKRQLKRISGLGMNEEELKANPILSDYVVVDLNEVGNPKLPYDDDSFNVVLCQLSIDYLVHPLEVMKEVSRILKPDGTVYIFFSNRLFLQKAIGLWTGQDDIDHCYTVGSYLRFCNGNFRNIKAEDLSTRKKGKIVSDPMYVVSAQKAIP